MDAIQKIKTTLSKEHIKNLLETHSSGLYDTGDGFRCKCPLHGGDNPTAFFWSYQNGLWYCFTGCHTGGDVFDFIRLSNGIPEDQFPTIIETTASILGINIEGLEIRERTREAVMSVQEWINYIQSRNNQPEANRSYDLHQLGELYKMNSYRNFTPETISYFGGCYSQTHNRIVTPIYNESGQTIGASLRRLNHTDSAKWLHVPKTIRTGDVLYNLNNCLDESKVYLVEGAFDVWNLYQIGVKNVVAVMGSSISTNQEKLLLKYFIDVCLLFDNDKAGLLATKKSIDKLKYKTNLTYLDLGEYPDPGEILSLEDFLNLKENHYSKFHNCML